MIDSLRSSSNGDNAAAGSITVRVARVSNSNHYHLIINDIRELHIQHLIHHHYIDKYVFSNNRNFVHSAAANDDVYTSCYTSNSDHDNPDEWWRAERDDYLRHVDRFTGSDRHTVAQ